MPEEIEVPTEHLHEELEHEAHHSQESWIMMVALTAALLSVLAAITALFASHYANEAMIEQIQASDQWAFYQAKGIKSAVLESKMELLNQMGKEADIKDAKNAERYKEEQQDIKKDATEKQEEFGQVPCAAQCTRQRCHIVSDCNRNLCHFCTYTQEMVMVRKFARICRNRFGLDPNLTEILLMSSGFIFRSKQFNIVKN